jgi:tripeptide aminopeptidase
MKVADFPELSFFKGHTLIHTDGTTLLGADDKAGIAELLVALRHAPRHPPLELVFTREEEKGLIGSRNLDYSLLTARRGYVLDMDAMDAVVIGCPTKINLDENQAMILK